MPRLGFRHDASLKTGGSTKLSVTDRRPRNGPMMQCSMCFWVAGLWSILLTFQNFRQKIRQKKRPQRRNGRGDRLVWSPLSAVRAIASKTCQFGCL